MEKIMQTFDFSVDRYFKQELGLQNIFVFKLLIYVFGTNQIYFW